MLNTKIYVVTKKGHFFRRTETSEKRPFLGCGRTKEQVFAR
ncbi:hypothetical protein MKY92_29755 [Paenibacillus sp. FSL R5-0623]